VPVAALLAKSATFDLNAPLVVAENHVAVPTVPLSGIVPSQPKTAVPVD
jgi:hypothetical protein